MKIFIDTANLNEIKEAADMGLLDGVTTNPSLVAKEGHKDFKSMLEKIVVSMQTTTSRKGISMRMLTCGMPTLPFWSAHSGWG